MTRYLVAGALAGAAFSLYGLDPSRPLAFNLGYVFGCLVVTTLVAGLVFRLSQRKN